MTGAGAGAGIFIILLFFKKMSETCVFPYLQFFDLRTMLIKKFEKIGGVSAKFHPNRSDFQFLVPAVFLKIIFVEWPCIWTVVYMYSSWTKEQMARPHI